MVTGSVRTLSAADGSLTNKYDYTAFGESYLGNTVETIANRYTYTGREKSSLASAGVPMYYRWRMYQPELGRFLKRDPIGYRDGVNIYCYASSNSVNFNDPLGLMYSNLHVYGYFGHNLTRYLSKNSKYLFIIEFDQPVFSNWNCEAASENTWRYNSVSSDWGRRLIILADSQGARIDQAYNIFFAEESDPIWQKDRSNRDPFPALYYKRNSRAATDIITNAVSKIEKWYDKHMTTHLQNTNTIFCSKSECINKLSSFKQKMLNEWNDIKKLKKDVFKFR